MPVLSAVPQSSYYDWAKQGQLFVAYATVTTPVIWSTAAGTGGPLLWNNTASARRTVNAALLALSVGIVTASGVAATLGITGGPTQAAAPTTTTAIDGSVNCNLVGPAGLCNVYRKGTVSAAGAFFLPTHTLDTGAVTVSNTAPAWVDLGGSIVVPPGAWASVAASATATSAVLHIALLYAEIPV
jgi:hypothetical protein